jgi:hypothetical protein
LGHFLLPESKDLRIEFCNSYEFLYELPTLLGSTRQPRVGAREVRQWACPRFRCIVCGYKGNSLAIRVLTNLDSSQLASTIPANACEVEIKKTR